MSSGGQSRQPIMRLRGHAAAGRGKTQHANTGWRTWVNFAGATKNRWQVELFFKWIKQHLRIKSFFGTSQNAVKTQIWIAVSVYVLVAIVKKRLGIDASLYTLLQILSVTLFEKMPLQKAFPDCDYRSNESDEGNQLNLIGF
jgi:hypothetical protein